MQRSVKRGKDGYRVAVVKVKTTLLTANTEAELFEDRLERIDEFNERLIVFIRRKVAGGVLRSDWEDVYQETVLKALRNFPDPLTWSWLRQVAMNVVIDRLRKRRPDTMEPEFFAELADGPGPDREFWESWQHCSRLLDGQSGFRRLRIPASELLRLRYVDEWTLGELAEYCGASIDQVHRWSHAGARAIAACLRQNHLGHE